MAQSTSPLAHLGLWRSRPVRYPQYGITARITLRPPSRGWRRGSGSNSYLLCIHQARSRSIATSTLWSTTMSPDHTLDKSFPGWVPPCVAQTAKNIWRDIVTEDGEIAEKTRLLHRLIFDPRMEKVRNQLRKKKRGIGYQPSEAFFIPRYYRQHQSEKWRRSFVAKMIMRARKELRCSKRLFRPQNNQRAQFRLPRIGPTKKEQ